jgi:chemotaxis response regulator CheB
VLVVDDEQDILDLLTIWLDDDPRCSGSRQTAELDDAIRIAAEWQPHVVVIDYLFGHRCCTEVLPELRRELPDSVIVVHTASRRAAEGAGVEALGADLVLEKGQETIDTVIDQLLKATRRQELYAAGPDLRRSVPPAAGVG